MGEYHPIETTSLHAFDETAVRVARDVVRVVPPAPLTAWELPYGERVVLGAIARSCAINRPMGLVFEVGTFEGETACLLAGNSSRAPVHTLDLPDADAARFGTPGNIGKKIREAPPEISSLITMHRGHSTTFDYSRFLGKCGLVYLDGSHWISHTVHEANMAKKMLVSGGVCVMDDIQLPTVHAALALLHDQGMRFSHVSHTRLAVWRAP